MPTKTEIMQLPGTAPGRNGVEIRAGLGGRGGFYRSYEVYQRQRVKESTYLLNGRIFLKSEFLQDPYPTLKVLREISLADRVVRQDREAGRRRHQQHRRRGPRVVWRPAS